MTRLTSCARIVRDDILGSWRIGSIDLNARRKFIEDIDNSKAEAILSIHRLSFHGPKIVEFKFLNLGIFATLLPKIFLNPSNVHCIAFRIQSLRFSNFQTLLKLGAVGGIYFRKKRQNGCTIKNWSIAEWFSFRRRARPLFVFAFNRIERFGHATSITILYINYRALDCNAKTQLIDGEWWLRRGLPSMSASKKKEEEEEKYVFCPVVWTSPIIIIAAKFTKREITCNFVYLLCSTASPDWY